MLKRSHNGGYRWHQAEVGGNGTEFEKWLFRVGWFHYSFISDIRRTDEYKDGLQLSYKHSRENKA